MLDLTKTLKTNVEITLLSIEEYESIRDNIPNLNCWWWLRSPCQRKNYATHVCYSGSVDFDGYFCDYDRGCVRPALKSKFFNPVAIGTVFSAFGNRWTICGNGFAISNGAIDFRRFDAESNDYEKSEIKKYLEEWIEK